MSKIKSITSYSKYWAWAVLWLLTLLGVLYYKQSQQALAVPVFVISNDAIATATSGTQAKSAVFLRHSISVHHPSPSVHAVSLSRFGEDKMIAAWFAGSREGAKDVEIVANQYSLPTQTWAEPYVILNRQQLSQLSKQYIKKLGNPVLWQTQDGVLHLFVVGVSLGGWAGSKIYHLSSTDGKQYHYRQTLPLSPFMNVSHLVRAMPVALADGGFYLPIYHEFAHKFPLLLRFDQQGEFVATIRPQARHLLGTLQPTLTALSTDHCVMTGRNRWASPIWLSACADGGQIWQVPIQLSLSNDNSSLNIINAWQNILLVHNMTKQNNSRYHLALSLLDLPSKRSHSVILDSTSDNKEVSYPASLVVDDMVHIAYTHNRSQIRHIAFNRAWLAKVDMP